MNIINSVATNYFALFYFQAEKYGDSFVMDYFVPENINKEIKQAVSVIGLYTGWSILHNEPQNLITNYIISFIVGICVKYPHFNSYQRVRNVKFFGKFCAPIKLMILSDKKLTENT